MESIWSLLSHRGAHGNSNVPDKNLVHICVVSDHGFAFDHLYDLGILDEHPELHMVGAQKSFEIPLDP
jgi:hypothetical protein